jgi:tryptophan synthase alpha chain
MTSEICKLSIGKQQRDLFLANIPNEVLNGFRVPDFQTRIGVSEVRFAELSERARNTGEIPVEAVRPLRNALVETLRELEWELHTRTGLTEEEGNEILQQLNAVLHEPGEAVVHSRLVFNHKPGLVIYLTAGDPDLATTRDMAIAAINAGADVIELGVPFSDPLADGPVIQRASERAVARGTRLADVLGICREIRDARPQAGIILFSYLNPVIRMGMPEFACAAKAAGADGVLLTDMIVEEAGEYLEAMRSNDLAPVFLAAPTSPDERLRAIAEHSRGFVYAISRVGITGTQTELAADAEQLVRRLKQFTKLPIALGFGISTPQHVEAVAHFADAAVIGSAVVSLVERTPPEEAAAAVGAFVGSLRGASEHNTNNINEEITGEVHA